MCPVPKAVQETPEKETTALPITPVDVTTDLDTTSDTSNLIHNNATNPSIEKIVKKEVVLKISCQIENDER